MENTSGQFTAISLGGEMQPYTEHEDDSASATGSQPLPAAEIAGGGEVEAEAYGLDDRVAQYLNNDDEDDEEDPYLPIEEHHRQEKDSEEVDNNEQPKSDDDGTDDSIVRDAETTQTDDLPQVEVTYEESSSTSTSNHNNENGEPDENPNTDQQTTAPENDDNAVTFDEDASETKPEISAEEVNQLLADDENMENCDTTEHHTSSTRTEEEEVEVKPPSPPREPRIPLTTEEIEELVLPLPPHTKLRVTYCEPDESLDEVICYGKLFDMKKIRKAKVWDVSYILEDDDGDMSWFPTRLPPPSGIIIYEIEPIARFPEGVGETREQKDKRLAEAEAARKEAAKHRIVHIVDDETETPSKIQQTAEPKVPESTSVIPINPFVATMSAILGDSQTEANEEEDSLVVKNWIEKSATTTVPLAPKAPTRKAKGNATTPSTRESSTTVAAPAPNFAQAPTTASSVVVVAPHKSPVKSRAPPAQLLLEDEEEKRPQDGGAPTKPPTKLPVKIPVTQAQIAPLPAKLKSVRPLEVASLTDEKKRSLASVEAAGSVTKVVKVSVTTPTVAKLQQLHHQKAPGSSKRDPTVKREPVIPEMPTVAEGTLFASPSVLLASHADDVVVPCAACRDPLSSLSLLWFTHLLTVPSCQGSPGRLSNDGRGELECCNCKKLLFVAEQTTSMMHKRCRERKGLADAATVAAPSKLPPAPTQAPTAATVVRKRSRTPLAATYSRRDDYASYDRKPRSPLASTSSVYDSRDYQRPRSPLSTYSKDAAYTARARSPSPPASSYNRDPTSSYETRKRSPPSTTYARDRSPPTTYARDRSPPTTYARDRSPPASDYYRNTRPRSRSRSPLAAAASGRGGYDREAQLPTAYDSERKSPPSSFTRPRTRSRSPLAAAASGRGGYDRETQLPTAYDSRRKSPPSSYTSRQRSRSSPHSYARRSPPSTAYRQDTASAYGRDAGYNAPSSYRERSPPGTYNRDTKPRSPLKDAVSRTYVPPLTNSAPLRTSAPFRSEPPVLASPTAPFSPASSEPRFISGIAGIKSATETAALTKNAPMYTKKGKLIQPASYTYVAPPSNAPPRVGYLMPPGVAPSAAPEDRKRSRSPSDYGRSNRRGAL